MKIVLIILVLLLAGCSSTQSTPSIANQPQFTDTMEIIKNAAETAPSGVKGEYILNIKTSGKERGIVYLNTELDYRDQRSITVAIHPIIVSAFVAKYGNNPGEYFTGKTILVNGEAKRIRINFYSQGKVTDKYYYQTHIQVTDISQIEVVSEHA